MFMPSHRREKREKYETHSRPSRVTAAAAVACVLLHLAALLSSQVKEGGREREDTPSAIMST